MQQLGRMVKQLQLLVLVVRAPLTQLLLVLQLMLMQLLLLLLLTWVMRAPARTQQRPPS
jgi:hypothetical protein